MYFLTLILPLLFTLTHALPHNSKTSNMTIGAATVITNCTSPVYIWSVGSTSSPEHTITHGNNYTETYHSDPATGGVAIKITAVRDGLYNGSPQLILAYSLVGNSVWYDLSEVFGVPFQGKSVRLMAADQVAVNWKKGTPPNGGENPMVQPSGKDLVLMLC